MGNKDQISWIDMNAILRYCDRTYPNLKNQEFNSPKCGPITPFTRLILIEPPIKPMLIYKHSIGDITSNVMQTLLNPSLILTAQLKTYNYRKKLKKTYSEF